MAGQIGWLFSSACWSSQEVCVDPLLEWSLCKTVQNISFCVRFFSKRPVVVLGVAERVGLGNLRFSVCDVPVLSCQTVFVGKCTHTALPKELLPSTCVFVLVFLWWIQCPEHCMRTFTNIRDVSPICLFCSVTTETLVPRQ